MDHYRETAEANMLELKKKEEKANRTILTIEMILMVVSTLFLVTAVVVGEYAMTDVVWEAVLIAVATIVFVVCIGVCVAVGIKTGYYECPECGHKYIPSVNSYIWAMHIGWTRKMKCPNCGKKCWQKKVLSK